MNKKQVQNDAIVQIYSTVHQINHSKNIYCYLYNPPFSQYIFNRLNYFLASAAFSFPRVQESFILGLFNSLVSKGKMIDL